MRYIGALITLAFLLPPAIMQAQQTMPGPVRNPPTLSVPPDARSPTTASEPLDPRNPGGKSVPLPRPRPQAQAYSADLWERARTIRQLPPPEYDKPYTGKLTITRARDKIHLAQLCNLKAPNIACAWPKADSCEIIMVSDEMIVADGWIPEIVQRHELGHCQFWPKDHPGQRTLP